MVRWVIAVALVIVLFQLIDPATVVALIARVHIGWFGAAVAIALADRALMIAKWYPLLRVQVSSIPIGLAARAYMASSFASLFLPASVGADALRAVALGRSHRATLEVGASIAAERLLGAAASGVMAVTALILASQLAVPVHSLLPWALASVVVSGAAVIVPMSEWVRSLVVGFLRRYGLARWLSYVERFVVAYHAYARHAGLVVVVGTLTLLEQLLPVLALWCVAESLALAISFPTLVVCVPLALFLARLPISVDGIGVTEGSLVYLLGLFRVTPAEALALVLTARLALIVTLLPGAVLWMKFTRRGNEAKP